MTARKFLTWVYIPLFFLDILLSKIFGYIPNLIFKYNIMSARFDIGNSISKQNLKHTPVKLKLKDIKNRKMRYSLFLSGIFKKWNIYYMYNFELRVSNSSDSYRDMIYITKDELKFGDVVYGERFSDWKMNKKYGNNFSLYLRRNGLKLTEFHKIEPQVFVIASLHSFRHEKMRLEREKSYKKSCDRDFEKKVKDSLKRGQLFSKSSVRGESKRYPLFHLCVIKNRIDLVKKFLDIAYDNETRNRLVTYCVDRDGDKTFSNGKTPIDLSVSLEMTKLLKKWENLEQYDRFIKIMKLKEKTKKRSK